jgi:hypothetical protein
MAKKGTPLPISVVKSPHLEPAIPSPDLAETRSIRSVRSTKLTYTNFNDDARYNAVRFTEVDN